MAKSLFLIAILCLWFASMPAQSLAQPPDTEPVDDGAGLLEGPTTLPTPLKNPKLSGQPILEEVKELEKKARTEDDLLAARDKYEEALTRFRELGDKKNTLTTLGRLGRISRRVNQYDKAIQYYEQALKLARDQNNLKAQLHCLNELGMTHKQAGRYEPAVECYERAVRVADETGDVKMRGMALGNLGIAYRDWGRYDTAIDYFSQGLTIAEERNAAHERIRLLCGIAYTHSLKNAKDEALTFAARALDAAKALNDPKAQSGVLQRLGGIHQHFGERDKALEYFRQRLSLVRELNDPKQEISALSDLGSASRAAGKPDDALGFYGKALEIARQYRFQRAEAAALWDLATTCDFMSRYWDALENYQKALVVYRQLGFPKYEGSLLTSIAIDYVNLGQSKKAAAHAKEALGIAERLKDRRGQRAALQTLGLIFVTQGQYDKAADFYRQALGIAEELKDLKAQAKSLSSLGSLYGRWGQYDKAAEHYEKALAIAEQMNLRSHRVTAIRGLAEVFAQRGQYDKATDYYKKALGHAREHKNASEEAGCLRQLAVIRASRGDYQDALTLSLEALEILEQIGAPTGFTKAFIGGLYLDMGQMDKAEGFIVESKNWSALGRLALVRGQYDSAEHYYEKLLKASKKNRSASNLFIAYTGLGLAQEAQGNDSKAMEYLLAAVKITEELRSSLPRDERERFFDVKAGGFYRTAPYEALARVYLRLKRPLEAFKESEFTKARVFAESLSRWHEGLGSGIPARVMEEDEALADQLAAVKKQLADAYEKQDKAVVQALEAQVLELEEQRALHVRTLRKEYPRFAASKYPEPMDLSQSALRDDEWVLAYDVTDTGVIIYLLQGKKPVNTLFKPVTREQVDDLVRRFRKPLEITPGVDSIMDKLMGFDFVAGKKLADILLGDVLAELPAGRHVVIVPDDSVGVVPFEMLPLNEGGKTALNRGIPCTSAVEFFGDRNPLSYHQSVTALNLGRADVDKAAQADRVLVMADPVFQVTDERARETSDARARVAASDQGLYKELMAAMADGTLGTVSVPRLNLTGELAEGLRQTYRDQADTFTGLEASKDRFLGRLSPDLVHYNKIVFATHGYFGKDLPGINEPVLILTLVPPGTDGFLRMTEVMSLKMNADIVALTACQSGLGRRLSGEGTMGMGRAFQFAGARAVLMSLWSVSERTSVDLMESFFRHLREGKTKVAALAEARNEIRKQGYDHPFFWAPFILVGDAGREP